MLFDLRARGRRRTVQAIYLTLAILMGGGLVFFGIGGNTSGGLFDAISGGGSGDGSEIIDRRVERAEQRVQANPRDAGAYAALAQARFQLAGFGENYDESTQQFTEKGQALLRSAAAAWRRHLQLAGDRPNPQVAALMVNAFTALGQLDQAVRAQEVVVEARPPAYGTYSTLAFLAYQAGQSRKGDLAAERAVELAPENLRPTIKQRLEQAKTQALQQEAQQAQQNAPPATTTPGTGTPPTGE